MALEHIFGFKFLRNKPKANIISVIPPQTDGNTVIETSSQNGFMGHSSAAYDMEASYKDENELINRYRSLSLYAEIDSAVQDIVNEAISEDEIGNIVMLDMSRCEDIPIKIQDKIEAEFQHVLDVMQFNESATEYFRRWYVEGRLAFQIVIDSNNPQAGIQDFLPFDATTIKKLNEIRVEKHPETGVDIIVDTSTHFIFRASPDATSGIKMAQDTVLYVSSGVQDSSTGFTLSHLHKAIRPANQLRMLEDANVIYFLSRAPERRIFKIDVGGLPRHKVDEYVRQVMNQYRNKQVYDAKTGEIKDTKQHLSMMEDFFLPVRDGSKGTDITTLPAGTALAQQLESIEFFRKKLFNALNIPVSRLEAGSQYSVGRATEITRDEIKFSKFIEGLRRKFSTLLIDALKVQCIFKGVMTLEDWDIISKQIRVVFAKDNHFAELKELDVIDARLDVLSKLDPYIGKHYSREYVDTHILGLTELEREEMAKQMKREAKEAKENGTEDDNSMGDSGFNNPGGFGGGGGSDFNSQPEMNTDFEASPEMSGMPQPEMGPEPEGAPDVGTV